MRFLNLSSNDSHFAKIQDSNCLIWDISNLYLAKSSRFALSTVMMITSNHKIRWLDPLIVSTNLMDADHTNPSGVIFTSSLHKNSLKYHSNILEFWNVDCRRPRQIIFKFQGVLVTEIKFFNIIIAFEEDEDN